MLSKVLLYPRLAGGLVIKRAFQVTAHKQSGHDHGDVWWGPEKNNGREVVGFGITGDENYFDRMDYWFPAIRFRKDDNVILPIRTKEKGSWEDLSLDEKKLLYRYSFRQTLSEFEAPTGYWKPMVAGMAFILSLVTLYLTLLKIYVYPSLPPTFQNEWKEASVERMLVMQKGQFIGAPRHFDYDKNDWKK